MTSLLDLEAKAAALTPFDAGEAARLISSPDLIGIGMLGEAARRARHGDRVTYVRVAMVEPGGTFDVGEASEVRIAGQPQSADDARAVVRDVAARAGAGVTVTGFSLADLVTVAGGDHLALADLARALRADGLSAVAAVPVDAFGDAEAAVEAVRAVVEGGLVAPRAVVRRSAFEERLAIIERAEAIAGATGAFRAFAPLPEEDPSDTPSTGYDDVRTIALARLCTTIPGIQVSWPLYGPKLAQVALAYGADDLDGVPAVDLLHLGRRRSPREDIERQIRSAFATPVERTGAFEARS